jgi:hypothetical protein
MNRDHAGAAKPEVAHAMNSAGMLRREMTISGAAPAAFMGTVPIRIILKMPFQSRPCYFQTDAN